MYKAWKKLEDCPTTDNDADNGKAMAAEPLEEATSVKDEEQQHTSPHNLNHVFQLHKMVFKGAAQVESTCFLQNCDGTDLGPSLVDVIEERRGTPPPIHSASLSGDGSESEASSVKDEEQQHTSPHNLSHVFQLHKMVFKGASQVESIQNYDGTELGSPLFDVIEERRGTPPPIHSASLAGDGSENEASSVKDEEQQHTSPHNGSVSETSSVKDDEQQHTSPHNLNYVLQLNKMMFKGVSQVGSGSVRVASSVKRNIVVKKDPCKAGRASIRGPSHRPSVGGHRCHYPGALPPTPGWKAPAPETLHWDPPTNPQWDGNVGDLSPIDVNEERHGHRDPPTNPLQEDNVPPGAVLELMLPTSVNIVTPRTQNKRVLSRKCYFDVEEHVFRGSTYTSHGDEGTGVGNSYQPTVGDSLHDVTSGNAVDVDVEGSKSSSEPVHDDDETWRNESNEPDALETYTSHGDEGTGVGNSYQPPVGDSPHDVTSGNAADVDVEGSTSSLEPVHDDDETWRNGSDSEEESLESQASSLNSDRFRPAEQDEHWDVDGEIEFPLPTTGEQEGEHLGVDLLCEVKCSFDVDSIYLLGNRASHVLKAMGSGGTCLFNSSINKTNTTNTSRIAADYHGNLHLKPCTVGQSLGRLKVISLHKFPNIGLCKVFKNDTPYTLSLFLLEVPCISECNYIKHEMLLTVISALNIAIDGEIPFDSEDTYASSVDNPEWTCLNFFELQDGSKERKRNVHGSQKQISARACAMFFHRYERALELMANNHALIDPAQQQRDPDYWQKRQRVPLCESWAVPFSQLKINAAFLLEKSTILATAAGTKKSLSIEGLETWDGDRLKQEQDRAVVKEQFQQFQQRQFKCIKRSLKKSFPVLNICNPLFRSVRFFFDVGLEMQPISKEFVLLPELKKSKRLLEKVCGPEFLQRLSDASDSEECSDDEEIAIADEVNLNVDLNANATNYSDYLLESIDNHVAWSKLHVMTFPKRFTRHWGNVHSGSAKLNAVEGLKKVLLVAPTSSHCLGGQIYTPSIRLETMHQTRPQQSVISSIIAHVINICTMGAYLNATVNESMRQVAICLQLLNETYQHMFDRRTRETSNVVRIEIFLLYNNVDTPIGHLPLFVPTDCVQMFNKAHVNDFERKMVDTHLQPINKIFHDIGRLAEENRVLSFDSLRVQLRNRIIASLEILTGIVDNVIKSPGIIQKNILEEYSAFIGITMDIPHQAREPLTPDEKQRTGFNYGVSACLFPQMPTHGIPIRNPPRSLHQIVALNAARISGHRTRPFNFPVFFSAMDRLVARSLSPGLNIGMLEGMKAQAKAFIIKAVGDDPGMVGMMDEPRYNELTACSFSKRHHLLRKLSRLLIMYVCHDAWKQLVRDKIFGANPDFESVHEPTYSLSSKFEDFPFVEEKIAKYTEHVPGTKFEKKSTITSTGKF
jgi:hypothetical protein